MNSTSLRRAAKTLATVTLGASTSEAAIVVFDLAPDVLTRPVGSMGANDSSTLHINGINLGAGTFTSSLINNNAYASYSSTYTNQFSFGAWNYGTPQQLSATDISGPLLVGVAINNTSGLGGLLPLSAGQSISSTNTWDSWASSTAALPAGTSYFGLRIGNGSGDYNYGWIEVNHGPAGDLWTRFAFENVLNQSILAGQVSAVPEASTLGFAGGLFGLVAAVHLRRRRQRQPAASDKFLLLAAGEKSA